jgi:hypothetical protein
MLVLTSPIDGVIVEREVVLGQYLQPQDTAFVVADLSEVWAMLEVFETDLPYLRILWRQKSVGSRAWAGPAHGPWRRIHVFMFAPSCHFGRRGTRCEA